MELMTVTRRAGLAFEIRLREHALVTDVAPAEGGGDAGLSPVELFAASVGGCLATMTQRYCDARHYTDGDVVVSLTLELAPSPSRVAALVVDVELPKDAPERARLELSALARRFPVPATLHDEPQIDIEFT